MDKPTTNEGTHRKDATGHVEGGREREEVVSKEGGVEEYNNMSKLIAALETMEMVCSFVSCLFIFFLF